MKENIEGNFYRTPKNTHQSGWDYIFLRTRLFFYIKVISSILRYNRRFAKKGLYTPLLWREQSLEILNICELTGAKFDISGIDNIRKVKNEPVVFVGNHMGLLETMILPSLIEQIKRVTFVVKSSLIDFPFFGNIMRATNPIVVGRENPRMDLVTVLADGLKNLQNNISVAIFPQSTRQPYFDSKKFNSLGIKLASRGNTRIVPFALKTDFLEQGKIIRDFGKLHRKKTVYIKFGDPLKIEGNGKREHERIIEFISENLKEWGTEIL